MMNENQKVLTYSAIGALFLTLWFCPWEFEQRNGNTLYTVDQQISPAFVPPSTQGRTVRVRMRTECMMLEWVFIGIAYTGLFYCFKKEPNGNQSH